jgi:tetratricopeptide (TPR) repeat protein
MEEMAGIPALEDRARALQAALHTRRMLIVVDDAWSLPAARALQLGGPQSAHLITTRLPALAAELAGDGALTVPELDPAAGSELLGFFASGLGGAVAEQLVKAVGGLPLAIVLMGRHLRLEGRMGQDRRVEAALARLQDPGARLELAEGRAALEAQPSLPIETPVTLRRVIALSDAGLSEAARQALGGLAVFPPKPNTFGEKAALAVTGAAPAAWDALLDAGLVESMGAGRFSLHPSVGDYAATLAGTAAAGPRLIAWASSPPPEREQDPGGAAADEVNVLTALRIAQESDDGAGLRRVLDAWFDRFEASGRIQLLLEHLDQAVAHARRAGPADAYGQVLLKRARTRFLCGDYAGADGDARASLHLAEQGDDLRAACACWKILTLAAQALGDKDGARRSAESGLQAAERGGLARERAELLTNLAALAAASGAEDEARRMYQAALSLARSIGARRLESAVLANLGVLNARRGDFDAAEASLSEALELAHAGGERGAMCSLLINLGALAFDRGESTRAEGSFREALDLARERGDPAAEALASANLGRVVAARGAYREAEALYEEGLRQARRIGHREHLAQLLINAGALRRLQGDPSRARAFLEEARELATAIGHARFAAAAEAELKLLGR